MRRKIMDELIRWKESGDHGCLLVGGARQVGKTYIIEEFGRTYRHCCRFDLSSDIAARSAFKDNRSVDEIIMGLSLIDPDAEFVPGETLIFLDEIQDCPEARSALKPLAIDGRYDVVASGSLLGLRLKDVKAYPVGYQDRLYLNPMDFEEFLWALNVKQDVIDYVRRCIRAREPIMEPVFETMSKYMRWYMVTGGMPQAVKTFVSQRKMDDVRRVQSRIVEDYMDDITRYADLNERIRVEGCFRSVSSQLADDNRRFTYSAIEGNPGRGADRYTYSVDWLLNAGIAVRCNNVRNPESPVEAQAIDNVFKLYMRDTGLLISRYDPLIGAGIINGEYGINKGAIVENAVADMLAYQNRPLLYLRRDRDADGRTDRMEVDFLLETSEGVAAVEVKSGAKRSSHSLHKAMDRYGLVGIMFETRNIFVDDTGVRHYPLFAAAFMDEIDPRPEVAFDLGGAGV